MLKNINEAFLRRTLVLKNMIERIHGLSNLRINKFGNS